MFSFQPTLTGTLVISPTGERAVFRNKTHAQSCTAFGGATEVLAKAYLASCP